MASPKPTPGSSRLYGLLGVPAPFDTSYTLVTSPILPPLWLAATRLTFAVYGTVFIIFRLAYEGIKYHTDSAFFSYFTSLSYIGLFSYFWASGVQTLLFALSGCKRYPLQRWYKPLHFLHMLLLSTIITFPIIVTIVFWSLLSSPTTLSTRYSAWTNISEHALNTVFAAFEIFFTNAGVLSASPAARGLPWMHLPFLLVLLACYLGVAYITAGAQGFYNPHTQHGLLAAYIVGIAIGEAIVFTLVRYLCLFRHHLSIRMSRFGMESVSVDEGSGKRYSGLLADGEDWEDVGRPSAGSRSETSGGRGMAV
ncbi:hypothetical protein PHLCEN_2v9215 [Hermanssonia centrifuga]|uniref:FAR-17a/AIG1-like protein n=1 Tax=Hermanssonia centrifuga TaxID=98765 RepID=A0A2R6NRJ4_9APHY|nr:hypothetical protein PHLCEN_2v9215 [Hermanssonia centrifuga]